MSQVMTGSVRVHRARDAALRLLGSRTERWRHTIGVARRAEDLILTLPADEDPEVLLAAAWLHDIGYAEPLRDTGFHPLDGARHLSREDWPSRIAALVANHSGACFVAEVRGLADALGEYADEHSALADALTFADQTVGPGGVRMTVEDRIDDMLRRHGPESPNARAHGLRGPHLLAVSDRVSSRLLAAGRTR